MRAYIIVDLGFGDAGKGLLTDFLTRRGEAGLIVRYNGGAQAGHNVVAPDGRHHTFSQFGAGMFIPDVRTYLSAQVVIDPLALLVEGDVLAAKGVADAFARLRISAQALTITPFHRAANRIREQARGSARHGSCGVGVGETVEDALNHPETRILAGDLYGSADLRRRLRAIRDRKRNQLLAFCEAHDFDPVQAPEFAVFEQEDIIERWVAAIARIRALRLVVSDAILQDWFQATQTVIFEGAQGVLLDGDAGFHPYTTWSRSTAANALALIDRFAPDARVCRIGILRAYAVRHGPGPLPTETRRLRPAAAEHNTHNAWQGAVRYGWFDAVLTRYALQVTGGVDTLAVTHLDSLPALDAWKYSPSYQTLPSPERLAGPGQNTEGPLTDLHLPPNLTLADRAAFTRALFQAAPSIHSVKPEDDLVIQTIERLLAIRVGFGSYGPSAADVRVMTSFTI